MDPIPPPNHSDPQPPQPSPTSRHHHRRPAADRRHHRRDGHRTPRRTNRRQHPARRASTPRVPRRTDRDRSTATTYMSKPGRTAVPRRSRWPCRPPFPATSGSAFAGPRPYVVRANRRADGEMSIDIIPVTPSRIARRAVGRSCTRTSRTGRVDRAGGAPRVTRGWSRHGLRRQDENPLRRARRPPHRLASGWSTWSPARREGRWLKPAARRAALRPRSSRR